MGIGNDRSPQYGGLVTQPHYPSWGLETRTGSIGPVRCCSHYPSWGLETTIATSSSCSSVTGSLPLMGIGNLVVELLTGGVLALITPHGDWKRPYTFSRPRNSSRLITPHGDWKPRLGSSRGSATRPHYPSWGLETAFRRVFGATDINLITPHGDWKPRPCGTLARLRQRLITPHGDWKRDTIPADHGLELQRLLITPHGDWKLVAP